MPEAPRPSPPDDGRVARNLFLDADPDLDALAQSAAGSPGQIRGRDGRRRGRGLVVLAEQRRSPRSTRPGDAERFSRPNGKVARLLAVARDGLRQVDAVAGRLLGGLAAGPYRALITIVALAVLLVAFSWLALDVRDTSTAREAADGRLARTAAALRYEEARIEALTAEVRQLAQSAPPTQASTAPATRPNVVRQPAAPQAASRNHRPR